MPLYDLPLLKYYNLHKMIFDIRNSPELKERYLKDPETIMGDYMLKEDEKKLLTRGDPVEMYNAGIYPYLLHYYWITLKGGGKSGVKNLQLFKKNNADDNGRDEIHE